MSSYINEFSKFTAIRKRFKQASDYNAFMRDLYKLYNATLENYKFLALSEDKWFNLFKNALARNLDNLCEEALVDYIRPIIQEYIDRQVSEKRPRIFNNLISLISQEVKVAREILKRFFRKLENLNINVTPEFYEFLKEKCYTLKKYLEVLGIYDMSFKEVKKFLNRERTIYDDFRNRNYSYKENVKLLDYVLTCLGDDKFVNNYNACIKTDNHRKVRYFIDNYPYFLEIHSVIKERYDVTDKTIDVAILSCSYAMLEVIIDSYRRYKALGQDTTFMDIIASRISVTFSQISKSDNIGEPLNALSECFPLNNGITEIEREKIINILISRQNRYNQKLIHDFKDGLIDDVAISDIIKSMQIEYEKYGRNWLIVGFNPRKSNGSSYGSKKKEEKVDNAEKRKESFYKKFKVYYGINLEERDLIVDKLIDSLGVNSKLLYERYISGLINVNDSEYNTLYKLILQLRELYTEFGKEILKEDFIIPRISMDKTFYDLFKLSEDISEDDRKKIVDILLNGLPADEKQAVLEYKDKKRSYVSVRNILKKMKDKCNRYGILILSPDFRCVEGGHSLVKPLYDHFPILSDMTMEERNHIVDLMVEKLSLEEQKEIQEFNAGLLPAGAINRILSKMKKKYNKNGKKLLSGNFEFVKKGEKETLFEYFPIKDGMNKDERDRIVWVLYSSLDESKLNELSLYFDNNLKRTEKILSNILPIIVGMKKKYENYGKFLLVPYFLEIKDYYEFCKLVGIREINPEEKERKINDFLDDYLQNVINYIKYEFNVQLAPVDDEKKKILMDAIKVIEYIYRDKRGLSKYEFQSYFYTRILEIFMDKPQDLENLIISFINIEYELVGCFERKV